MGATPHYLIASGALGWAGTRAQAPFPPSQASPHVGPAHRGSPASVLFPPFRALAGPPEFGFPVGYEGPVPTPTFHNHPSAVHHSNDVVAYIMKELGEGAMLGPFDQPPFTPWTQTNPLLTRPKKDFHLRRVIMDLSWFFPLQSQRQWGHSQRLLFGRGQKTPPPVCQRFLRSY